MTDAEIIDQAYEEILKQIFKNFHLDGDELKFKSAVKFLRERKLKAIKLL